MKVCFETFGCRLNRAEALEAEARFLARGWTRTERHDDADLVVVRGCSVTARAQRECERLIDHIRRKYPMKRVVVTGCMAKKANEQWLRDLDDGAPAVPSRTARAYLKVQDGCNSACAFCIVPKFRGAASSVPFADVLDRARRFVDAGYSEIVLTGCNLMQYASDGKSFADLVSAVAELPGAFRVRVGSVEPTAGAADVVRAMAEHENVCRFLHVPVQTGSARLLAAMRRPYSAREAEAVIREAVSLMPGLGLGCDVMTGFPDERDNDHLATLSLLRRHPFTNVHVFPFSARPGTVAAVMPNAVPPAVRAARAKDVSKAAGEMRLRYARRFKGRTVDVVVENEEDVSGWTGEYLWCRVGKDKAKVFAKSGRCRRKSLVRILVREAKGGVLTGDPV